jgi:acetylornithine/N-succinyldiaminopimelate aminotransferase
MEVLNALLPTYAPFPFVMVSGRGDRVFGASGESYLDFYGGHCVCATGHSHPSVVNAIAKQAESLLFYSSAASLSIREEAAEKLAAFSGMDSVFFCNSGAEANENALKLALQITGRKRLGAFEGGWHGRTLLALSVTDDPKITDPFAGFLAPVTRIPFGDLDAIAKADFSELAALILEPIQSMAGVKTSDAAWFQALRKKCDASGTLLIFDEIQTGMGRLGMPFASDFYGVKPDLMTSAKALASGVPMGAVLMRETIASQIKSGWLGSTFGGGPLACAALLATLQVIESEELLSRATKASRLIQRGLQGSVVESVLGEGLLLGLKTSHAAELKKHLYAKHILVGGSHDPEVLRLMPPLNVLASSIDALLQAVHSFQAEERP